MLDSLRRSWKLNLDSLRESAPPLRPGRKARAERRRIVYCVNINRLLMNNVLHQEFVPLPDVPDHGAAVPGTHVTANG